MLNEDEYIDAIIAVAKRHGSRIEINARNGLKQINFGNKKLHAGHLVKLYPAILRSDADIPTLINNVAPGRPCTHRPMREIIQELRVRKKY